MFVAYVDRPMIPAFPRAADIWTSTVISTRSIVKNDR